MQANTAPHRTTPHRTSTSTLAVPGAAAGPGPPTAPLAPAPAAKAGTGAADARPSLMSNSSRSACSRREARLVAAGMLGTAPTLPRGLGDTGDARPSSVLLRPRDMVRDRRLALQQKQKRCNRCPHSLQQSTARKKLCRAGPRPGGSKHGDLSH
jgi:hypothetical protein